MTASGPVIKFQDVCFSYTGEEVLHNASFAVPDKALVAVVGPNGGGKSTLLRLMLGLLQSRYGMVRVFGQSASRVSRRIGYVPQHLAFDARYPVTALDVVRMGRIDRHRWGRYRRDDTAAADRALVEVDMLSCRNRPFAQLSGGERQRVLIAHALVSDPDLLLLDEPTANVDPATQTAIHELFHKLNASKTLVFVSHNVNVVTRHVSHVLCVNHTAALHPIEEIMSASFTEAHGGQLAVLLHDLRCHITDGSRATDGAHAGAGGGHDG